MTIDENQVEMCDCGFELKNCLKCLNVELEEFRSLIALQHRRNCQVLPHWQKATGKDCWPDYGDLLVWLIDRYMESQDLLTVWDSETVMLDDTVWTNAVKAAIQRMKDATA